MTLQKNLLTKRFAQLAVLLLLATSMVPLTAQGTLAIPLKPLLDRMGRHMLEGVFNVDPATQPSAPATQLSKPTQPSTPTQPSAPATQPSTPASSPESPSAPSGSLPPTNPPPTPPAPTSPPTSPVSPPAR